MSLEASQDYQDHQRAARDRSVSNLISGVDRSLLLSSCSSSIVQVENKDVNRLSALSA